MRNCGERLPAKKWTGWRNLGSSRWSRARPFLLAPGSTSPNGFSRSKPTTATKRAWWSLAGAKSRARTAVTHTPLFAVCRACEWCWLSPWRWTGIQLDVNTAFLYAFLEEDVHVAAAPGYEKMDKDGVPLVMKLHKSLYGLAQSPGDSFKTCLLYTSPSPRDRTRSRMPSSA